jgi:hypothetical protein
MAATHPTDAAVPDNVHAGRTGRGPRVQDADSRPTREQAATDVRAPGTPSHNQCQVEAFKIKTVGSKGE